MSAPMPYGLIGVVNASATQDVLDFIYAARQERWHTELINQEIICFYPPTSHHLNIEEAWDLAHRLTAAFGDFDPLIDELVDEQGTLDRMGEAPEGLNKLASALAPAPSEPDWSLDVIQVQEAWAYMGQHASNDAAASVIIAHPDAGFKPHDELDGQIRHDLSRDFVGRRHPMASHGVSTASVIISQDNRAAVSRSVTGVAPRAQLIPMRVTYRRFGHEAILYWRGVERLTQAIYYAIEQGAHIISISLGFLGCDALHHAIKTAYDQDIIIIAAGSNYTWRFITWPARYSEVIAMAGCNASYKRWKFSARGPAIDAVGPGERVWCASFADDGDYRVAQSDGTSFATAICAGVAALWIEHHGRDTLLKLCRAHHIRLGRLFLEVINQTSTHQENFDRGDWGAGIINANNIVRANLDEIIAGMDTKRVSKQEFEPVELAQIKNSFQLTDDELNRVKDDPLAKRELSFYRTLLPPQPVAELAKRFEPYNIAPQAEQVQFSASLRRKLGR